MFLGLCPGPIKGVLGLIETHLVVKPWLRCAQGSNSSSSDSSSWRTQDQVSGPLRCYKAESRDCISRHSPSQDVATGRINQAASPQMHRSPMIWQHVQKPAFFSEVFIMHHLGKKLAHNSFRATVVGQSC